MRNKNTIQPRNKTSIRLKRALLISGGVIILSGIIWKFVIGTGTTVAFVNNSSAQYTTSSGPQLSGYSWANVITVDHSKVMDSINLVDFPILLKLQLPELKTTQHGGYVENNYGYDIAFVGENDRQLDHQVESYSGSSGELIVWVKLPVLYHDLDTEFKILVGNNQVQSDMSTDNVWSSDYDMVYHMNNNPGNSITTDAAQGNDAHPYGNMNSQDLVNGKIGKAVDFDGSNDYMAISNKHFNTAGGIQSLTVSAWVNTSYNHSAWNSNWSILDFDRSENFNFFVHGQGKIAFCTRGSNAGIDDFYGGQNGQVNDGNWHFVAGVYDGNNKYLYIDGVLVNTVSDPHNGNYIGSGMNRYGYLGDGSESSSYNSTRNNINYEGKLDEVRMLHTPRSSGWIATEFNNQAYPETFYSLGQGSGLPIELVAFRADLDNGEVLLSWDVASQRDNDYFTIERSTDGKNFEIVGKVNGDGTTEDFLTYHLTDSHPLTGLSYYRLKQTDYNGKYEAFLPVAVNNISATDVLKIESVYPNPFSTEFTLKYTSESDNFVTIQLSNSEGQTIFRDEAASSKGNNSYTYFDSESLPQGVYFLTVLQGDEVRASTKLMKR